MGLINVAKIGNSFLNSKFISKVCPEHAGDAAATIALMSTTTKDLVNCIYYTEQSLNNKKIPEEKRKFVAGIDLSNGILNVVSQLTLGMYLKNKIPKAFDYMFKNSKLSPQAYACAKGGFTLFGTLVFAQVLLKRVLTPFIATPMAGYFKQYAERKEQENGSKQNPSTEDTFVKQQPNTEVVAKNEAAENTTEANKVETTSTEASKLALKPNSPFEAFETILKK